MKRKNSFYTECRNGHKYHISWPRCPQCKDGWREYHQDEIIRLGQEIERHKDRLKELEQ